MKKKVEAVNRLQKLFQRNKKKEEKQSIEQNIAIRPFHYHPKIILAWAKGLEGNTDLLKYLKENGFEELVYASKAIYGKESARNWLMKNGFPQINALINAYENNQQALEWLKKNNFPLFYQMALAIKDDDNGFQWINQNSTQEIFLLTKIIKHIKEERDDEQYYRVNKKRMGLSDEE